jgi:hypothetical protein
MTNRDISSDTAIDRDDSVVTDDDMPVELLRKMLSGSDDASADEPAFGAGSDPKDAPTQDVVSIEDGIDLIDSAQKTSRDAAKVEAPADDSQKPVEESAEPADDAKPATTEAPAANDLDALLDGLPDDRKAPLRERLSAADEVLGIFKGREAELERHGVKPADAMRRLVDINAYANREPDAYLAWAATQFGDPAALLTKAAEKLGLKMVAAAAEDDDDPFEDPEVKALKAKLARYEAQTTAPQLGPDAPQVRAQNDLQDFAKASPHWDAVGPQVAALATTHVQTTGKAATMDDIKRFYAAAVVAGGLQQPAPTTPAPTLAAQPQPPVTQKTGNTVAAPPDSVQRAKAASRSLDGSGQGAGRRPVLSEDAALEDVVSHFFKELKG